MRNGLAVLMATVMAMPLAAQGGMAGMAMDDPTNSAHGSGKLPDGWMLRFDPAGPMRGGGAPPPPPAMTDVNVATMGTGIHFKSGPAAIYYNSKDMASGSYTYTATFAQSKSNTHEAYGIFIGGSNLQASNQNYLYFVIKPCRSRGTCDPSTGGTPLGEALISYRSSDAAPTAIFPTVHADAVNAEDKTGAATNKLSIKVTKDSVWFMANDKLVKAFAKTELKGAVTDGQVGIRMNHNSEFHLSDIKIIKP